MPWMLGFVLVYQFVYTVTPIIISMCPSLTWPSLSLLPFLSFLASLPLSHTKRSLTRCHRGETPFFHSPFTIVPSFRRPCGGIKTYLNKKLDQNSFVFSVSASYKSQGFLCLSGNAEVRAIRRPCSYFYLPRKLQTREIERRVNKRWISFPRMILLLRC